MTGSDSLVAMRQNKHRCQFTVSSITVKTAAQKQMWGTPPAKFTAWLLMTKTCWWENLRFSPFWDPRQGCLDGPKLYLVSMPQQSQIHEFTCLNTQRWIILTWDAFGTYCVFLFSIIICNPLGKTLTLCETGVPIRRLIRCGYSSDRAVISAITDRVKYFTPRAQTVNLALSPGSWRAEKKITWHPCGFTGFY